MNAVLLREFRELPRRLGGVKGFFGLAALAALGSLPPWRLGLGFLDPVILVAYASFALLFSSFFTAQSFAGAHERQDIDNAPVQGVADRDLVAGKVLAATLYGWLAWLIIFGAALAALAARYDRLALPAASLVVALALLAAGFGLGAAGLGSGLALRVFSAASARQMFRLAYIFLLIVFVAFQRFLPEAWTAPAAALLAGSRAAATCSVIALLSAGAGLLGIRNSLAILAERRAGLSIL